MTEYPEWPVLYIIECAITNHVLPSPTQVELYDVDRSIQSQLCRDMRKPTLWFPTRSDTNRAVQAQKLARGWKFWIYKVEELYFPCSENKGADQLRSNCEADLRHCFRPWRLLVFQCGGKYNCIDSCDSWIS